MHAKVNAALSTKEFRRRICVEVASQKVLQESQEQNRNCFKGDLFWAIGGYKQKFNLTCENSDIAVH